MRLPAIAFSLVALAAPAAAAPSSLPPDVQRYIAGFDQVCRQAGGSPGNHAGMITVADLTGDGQPDFVVDIHNYNCIDAPASVAAGRDGMAVAIFVAGSGDNAFKAFEAITDGATVEQQGGRSRVYLDVGGVDCGQQNAATLPYTEWKFCSRPLDWSAAKKTFQFAPVSQARSIE